MIFMFGIGNVLGSVTRAIGGVVSTATGGGGGLGGVLDVFSKIGGGGGGIGSLIGTALGGPLGGIIGSIAERALMPRADADGASGGLGGLIQKGLDMLGGFLGGPGSSQFGLVLNLLDGLFGEHPSVDAPVTEVAAGAPEARGQGGLLDAAGRAYDEMAGIEQRIADLDPEDPNYQKDMMLLQSKMQKVQQMLNLVSQILKMRHDTAMGIIRNIS